MVARVKSSILFNLGKIKQICDLEIWNIYLMILTGRMCRRNKNTKTIQPKKKCQDNIKLTTKGHSCFNLQLFCIFTVPDLFIFLLSFLLFKAFLNYRNKVQDPNLNDRSKLTRTCATTFWVYWDFAMTEKFIHAETLIIVSSNLPWRSKDHFLLHQCNWSYMIKRPLCSHYAQTHCTLL